MRIPLFFPAFFFNCVGFCCEVPRTIVRFKLDLKVTELSNLEASAKRGNYSRLQPILLFRKHPPALSFWDLAARPHLCPIMHYDNPLTAKAPPQLDGDKAQSLLPTDPSSNRVPITI